MQRDMELEQARKNIRGRKGDPEDGRQLMSEIARLRQHKRSEAATSLHGAEYSKPDPYASAFDWAPYRRDAERALRDRGEDRATDGS